MTNFLYCRGCGPQIHETVPTGPKCGKPQAIAAKAPRPAMALARFGLGALAAMLAFATPAAEGRWAQGFGQGNLEYFADAQGMRLHIGCPTQEGSADESSSVSLVSATSSKEVKKFTLKAGGRTYEGPFVADNRAGENNFLALLDDLRKSDVVVSYAGKTLTFPKSNAAQVLPAYGKKGFNCNLG